jgi:hypothetical protein
MLVSIACLFWFRNGFLFILIKFKMNYCGLNYALPLKLQLVVPFGMAIILVRYNYLHVELEHVLVLFVYHVELCIQIVV